MYARKDKSPRLVTPGFEHLNNFVLFDDGRDVFIKRIENDESLTTNLVQFTKMPLSTHCTYYTMTIKDLPEGEFIMFGLTNRCVTGNPMWIIDRSVRYHSNDGGVFNGGLGVKTYHPYGKDDKVTCRLDYTGPDSCLINFLKNDKMVYRQWVNLPPGQLYPTIGISRTEARLRVEWPNPGRGDLVIQKELTTNWFGWTGLERDDTTMTVKLAEPDTEMERSAYNIQCPTSFNQDFTYFEVEIIKRREDEEHKGCNAIGLAAGNCEPFVLPGWAAHSIGYHSDDGCMYFDGTDKKTENSDEAHVCKEGDRMGCGIIFPAISPSSLREPILVLVYFTKNGQLVNKKRMRQPRGGFFPNVGFVAQGDAVKLHVNCPPPAELQNDLVKALNSADVTSHFRCSELIEFDELAPSSAVFKLSVAEENPQLVQYLMYPLSNVGDGFYLEVLNIDSNTELQLGVSGPDHPMEGSFLGSTTSSCGYLLRLGSLAMKEGMRTVEKWTGQRDIINCYLDFKDSQVAIICFEKGSGQMIGRATVACTDPDTSLYASVVMSLGPCTVRMNWSRSLYNTQSFDRTWGSAETWLRSPGIKADKNKLTLKATDSYTFAACAQGRQPLLTGSSFFSIKILGGETFPGIGLSKSTTDVNNVLGSESGEVSFLPSTGELIMNNNKWRLKSPPEFKKGDILQCGMLFAESDRVRQKGVVYFCINDQHFFHCRFIMSHGGVYPTVTFSTAGCCAEILQNSRSQPIPESLAEEWLNSDTMEGVVPYTATDLLKKNGYNSSGSFDADVVVIESETSERVIYISYTVREKDRVDPFINMLRRHYMNFVIKTSVSCVEILEKQEVVSQCELIVIFMTQLYCESHEMSTEYSLFQGKPIILAADRYMSWPPGHYFLNDPTISHYPTVFIEYSYDTHDFHQMINTMNNQLKGMSAKDGKRIAKKGKNANGKIMGDHPMNGHTLVSEPAPANKSSSTCQLL